MDQAYLFNVGRNYQAYNLLGSFPLDHHSEDRGFSFRVWAPKAQAVFVV